MESLEYWDEWSSSRKIGEFFKTDHSEELKKLFEEGSSYEDFMNILLSKGYLNID